MKKNYRIAPDIKEQILKRIKEEGVSVSQVANDHGIHKLGYPLEDETIVYHWLGAGERNKFLRGLNAQS